MNLFYRILLAVYAVILTIISIITIIVTLKPELFVGISKFLYEDVLTASRGTSFLMFFVAIIFLALSITFLLSGLRSNKDKKAVSKYTNIGEIRISLNSIENIALNASKKLSGVRETKAYVTKLADGVSIGIKAIVMAELNIPELSKDIQVRVKNSIEETTGIKVNDVRVMVENIYTGYKSRVE